MIEIELSKRTRTTATLSTQHPTHSTNTTTNNSNAIIMSQGGLYPWQRQKIHQPTSGGLMGTCSTYATLSNPLPDPPKGQTWIQNDETKEWQLVPVANATVCATEVIGAVDRGVITDDSAGEEEEVRATAVAMAYPTKKTSSSSSSIRYHELQPTDTFQGICLRYKVTPTELRRANGIHSGTSLKLAPAKLIIPANGKKVVKKREGTNEEKIAALYARVRMGVRVELSSSEARAYLDLADWDLDKAVADVKEDFCS